MEVIANSSIEKLVELLKAGVIDEKTFVELTSSVDNNAKFKKKRSTLRIQILSLILVVALIGSGWVFLSKPFSNKTKTISPEELAAIALPYFEGYAKSSAGGFERMKSLSVPNSDAEWYMKHQENLWKAYGEVNQPDITKIEGARIVICSQATLNDTSCRLNTKYSDFIFSELDPSKLVTFNIDGLSIRQRRKFASLDYPCQVLGNVYCGSPKSFNVEAQTTYLAASDSLFLTYTIFRGSEFNKGFSYNLLGATAEIPGMKVIKSKSFSKAGPTVGQTKYAFVAFENMSAAIGKKVEITLNFSYGMKFKVSVQM